MAIALSRCRFGSRYDRILRRADLHVVRFRSSQRRRLNPRALTGRDDISDWAGLNRQDIDLRAGTVLVERSLHEFYDGRSSSVRRRTATPARSTCRARSCRRSRTTSAVSSALRATLPSSLGQLEAAPSEQLRGHLGDRTPAGRADVGALPRPAPLRRHDVRLHRRQHEGDHEPRRVEVRRHGGALRARIRGARRIACPGAESVRRERRTWSRSRALRQEIARSARTRMIGQGEVWTYHRRPAKRKRNAPGVRFELTT